MPFAIIGAIRARRRYAFSSGWAFATVSAAMLPTVPFVLRGDASWWSQRVIGVMLVIGFMMIVVERGRSNYWSGVQFGRREASTRFIIAAPFAIGTFAMAVGLYRGNELFVIAGDGLRWFVTATAIVVGIGMTRERAETTITAMAWVAVFWDFVAVGFFALIALSGQFSILRVTGGFAAALAFGFVMLLGPRGRRPRPFAFGQRTGIIILTASLVAGALSLTRATWAGSAFMLMVGTITVATVWNRRDIARTMASVAFAAILVFGGYALTPQGQQTVLWMQQRVQSVSITDHADVSLAIRDEEAKYARIAQQQIPLGELIGAGAGATYAYPPFDEPDRHQVHYMIPNIDFRSGLIGLGIFVPFIALLTWRTFRALKHSDDDIVLLWAALVVVMTLIVSTTEYKIIGDPIAGIAIGFVLRQRSQQRARGSGELAGSRRRA
ncbi:MAG: hypothetical protein HKO76_08425 [Acidimicrobiia bacterium]|nr:hypothetical protein [Acidimicrobiia bacterium]